MSNGTNKSMCRDDVVESPQPIISPVLQATVRNWKQPGEGNGNGNGHFETGLPWLRDVPPILRWAGGKRQLIKTLIEYLPRDLGKRKYHEPFLGAGSLFFRLAVPVARLADANEHLIET